MRMKASDGFDVAVASDYDFIVRAFADPVGVDQAALLVEIGSVLDGMETRIPHHLQHGADEIFAENKAFGEFKA